MDLQPAAIPKVPQQVRLTLGDDDEDMGGVQPSAAASQVAYMADTTIRPVPRPRPTPRSTLSNMPRHTVGFPSDLAIPGRLGDAMLTPQGVRTYLPTTGPGHGRAVQGQRKMPALRDIPKSMCYDGSHSR